MQNDQIFYRFSEDLARSRNANNVKFRQDFTRLNVMNCYYSYRIQRNIAIFKIEDIWKENLPKSNLHIVVKIEVIALLLIRAI
ncbi:hypothetical protein GLOIN_2v1654661 [Rhizophagus clarus]|uniref:Uncharacterized protein n=1 Tax=Rhizophagus clarus TaxID=94130 RepID=A0A8H3LVT7_9GLOM|nr:hypothetical protein GLOIN_2v1654661 [Rhizophagus clarus]